MINNPIYYPLLSSRNLNGGALGQEEFNDIWTRFDGLVPEKKNVIGSKKIPEKVQAFQGLFRLDDQSTESVSVLIRSLFFGQIELDSFRNAIAQLVEKFSPGKSQEALAFIQKEIVEMPPEREEVPVVETESRQVRALVSLPLLQALSKYQQLGNQMISNERIKIKSQPEPVRGSLFNWIKYYRDELGVGFHDRVQRGNFLFRSENGRKLSEDERERVNIILRSVEEEYPVQIDTTAQEIIFPEREQRSRNAFPSQEIPRQSIPQGASIMRGPAFATPGTQSPSAGNRYESGALHVNHDQPALPPKKVQMAKKPMGIGGLSFSFNHVLPAEKEKMMSQKQEVSGNPNPQVSSSLVFTDLAPEPPKPRAIPPRPLQSNPFHIRPVSLAQDDQKDR